jgi:methylated-DNA-[protein]-cysteine S-methyltransferase
MFYQILKVGKAEIGLVWSEVGKRPQVEYIYLPCAKQKMVDRIRKNFPAVSKMPRRITGGIDQTIAGLYEGRKLAFDLKLLNWSGLSDFSARVLKQTYKIPRGKVATYSGLAAKVDAPGAARAVGTVMANNPFPIVIPCHRVVRAGGSVGEFGGGSNMKKQLLEKEGLILDEPGRIPVKDIQQ